MIPTLNTSRNSKANTAIKLSLAFWFTLVFVLSLNDQFARSPTAPPLPILCGVAIPILLFVATYRTSAIFRAAIFSADLRLLTAIQAWRAGGMAFLALYAHGILPALFAFPAGIGDIAIGVSAPWIALKLTNQPDYANTRHFAVWNILGIADLVIAVSAGALSSGFVPVLAGNVTTSAMANLPLVLIPAFLVPMLVMLHVAALVQARNVTASKSKRSSSEVPLIAAMPRI